jgi:glycosyltransferase involved in cell wall biosynthesis
MKDFILLIPYFNDFEGLIASLKSINYPATEFEVLVVDDGSKIPLNTEALKVKFPSINITVLSMPANAGIAKALNAGLNSIHSRNEFKYIARLDCGDTCASERFTEQVKFMNEHSEIGLLGTWCRFIDSVSGSSYLYKTKTTHLEIVKEMHLKCSFIHPTVMFRKEVLDTVGYYPENYPHAEDYAYFWKTLKYYKGEILPEIYVDIVSDMQTISASNYNNQARSRAKIIGAMGTIPLLKYAGILSAYLRMVTPYKLIVRTKFLFFK